MSELPNGWVGTTLGEVVDYAVTEKAEPIDIQPNDWILELEDIEKDSSKLLSSHTFEERQSKSTKNRFSKGDVLYGKLRPYLNKVLIADADGYCTTEIIPIKPNECVDSRFVFYALKRKEFLNYVQEIAHGLNMPRLGTEQGRNAPFRLAPLNEQKRIAEKLDRLLARVDAAKARLDKIPPLLKRLRQAILAAATTGKLTEEWREENGIDQTTWLDTTFGTISAEITVGFVGKMADKYQDSGIPFLRSQNVRAFRFNAENLLYISEDFHRQIFKSRLTPGDLAIVRSGAPGTTCVIPDELPIANCSDLVIVRPGDELDPHFGAIYMNSEVAQRHVETNRVGVAQQHFNVGSMKEMDVHLPSLTEQNEIVRRVEELFAIAARIEAQYRTARARVDRLTQSLLAKAFRGELVPQDPNDEPAAALLERIRAQRAAAPQAKRGRRKKEEVDELPMVAEPKRPYRNRKRSA